MTNQEFLAVLNKWDTGLSPAEENEILDRTFEAGYRDWVNGTDEEEEEEEE